MDFKKANWQFGQRVRVCIPNEAMDGIEGIISGIASINWFDVYIVTLSNPMEVGTIVMPKFQSFTMPETHLRAIAEFTAKV